MVFDLSGSGGFFPEEYPDPGGLNPVFLPSRLHVPDGPQGDVTVNSWLDYLRVLDILSKSRVETASDSMRIAKGIVLLTEPGGP